MLVDWAYWNIFKGMPAVPLITTRAVGGWRTFVICGALPPDLKL